MQDNPKVIKGTKNNNRDMQDTYHKEQKTNKCDYIKWQPRDGKRALRPCLAHLHI